MRGWRQHRTLAGILLASLAARIVMYSDNTPLWDASAYVMMGKYAFSGGTVGLWEDMRPLAWPLLLGLGWRVGLDPLVVGQGLQVIFGLGLIAATSAVGRQLADRPTGLVAAGLVAASPILFNWGNHLYTGLPATALVVAAAGLLLSSRWGWGGVLLGLSAMFRFPLGLAGLALILLPLVAPGGSRWGRGARFAAGVALPILPYLIFNAVRYGDAVHPFRQGSGAFGAYTHIWDAGRAFYVAFLVQHENALLALSPLAFLGAMRARQAERVAILGVGWLFLAFFSLSRVHLIRYIIPALPFLYLGSALAVVWVFRRARTVGLRVGLALVVVGLAAVPWKRNLREFDFAPRQTDVFQEAAAQYQDLDGQSVWISSPSMIVFTQLRADRLIYYPVFDEARARALERDLPLASMVLISRYDIPCTPTGDAECLRARDALFAALRREFRVVWESTDATGAVEAGIYVRPVP